MGEKKKFKEMKEKFKEEKKKKKKIQKKYQELKKESDTCPLDSVVLNDSNVRTMLSDYSSDKKKIKCFDTSLVTDMDNLFQQTEFNADISSWDVSSVTRMVQMFEDAHKFNSDVSDWDVSSVTRMNSMFFLARKLDSDVSSWDVSSVTNMECYYSWCCPGETGY